jgi:hypothetical protein
MSRKLKLTKHSNKRYAERTKVDKRDFEKNGRTARSVGLRFSEIDINDIKLFNLMKPKSTKAFKKYYNGYIYVFSSNGYKLITVYEVTDQEAKEKLEEIWKKKKRSFY